MTPNRSLTGALAALCVFAGGLAPARGDEAGVRKELQTVYNAQAKALRAKDLKAYMAALAPNFSAEGLRGGKRDRQQFEAGIKQGLESQKSVKELTYKIEGVELKGDEAIVRVTQRLVGTLVSPQGTVQGVDVNTTERHTWTRTAGGWRLRLTEPLVVEGVIDGRRIKVQAAAENR